MSASRIVRGHFAEAALGLAACAVLLHGVQAQAQTAAMAATDAPAQRDLSDWLMRMHEASRQRSYIGTFVVSAGGGALSSARIWHACDGREQVERVEVLSGTPRATFRRDEEVLTFLPDARVVRAERRESIGLFPQLLKGKGTAIPDFYTARVLGSERVAGFDADVVQVQPRDALRFGYRIWSEKKSGMVIKLQTLDAAGQVLEQVAFSELQIDAPVRMDKLKQMMATPEGWRLERAEAVKTTPEAEGWTLRQPVAGFRPVASYKRGAGEGGMQWIFSDGLASVSLFLGADANARRLPEGVLAGGATHTLSQRLESGWLTAVGEVPPATLKAFAQGLERRR